MDDDFFFFCSSRMCGQVFRGFDEFGDDIYFLLIIFSSDYTGKLTQGSSVL